MGACFVFTVFTLYGLYNTSVLVKSYADPKLQFASVLLMWTLYMNFFVIRMLSSGSAVRREVNNLMFYVYTYCNQTFNRNFLLKGKNTGVIIHKYINKCTNRMLIDTVLISRSTHCKWKKKYLILFLPF